MASGQDSKATQARVRPAYMAHFVVRTSKYQQCVSWYRKLLDADDVFVSDVISFLTFDEEHHRIAIVNIDGLDDFSPSIAGIDHVAFSMDSVNSLIAQYERLKELGIRPVRVINHGPTTSFYYQDPNGSRIEMQVDNISLPGGPASYFTTEAFLANPSGVEIDPEELAAALRAGRSEADLLRMPAG